MLGNRKRRIDEEQHNASTAKVRIVPVYSNKTSDNGVRGNGNTLSLPCTLGRCNLAELWWKHCPNRCHAERPQAKPCTRFCSPVRRKSHRTLLSRKIVAIDPSGNIHLHAKNTEIIRWSPGHCGSLIGDLKRISPGEKYVLMFGDFQEEPTKPWMSFQIDLCPVVTPEHTIDQKEGKGQVSQTRRRLFRSESVTTFSEPSPGNSGDSEMSHHDFTQRQNSLKANRENRKSTVSDQSPAVGFNQSGSSQGDDKLNTQEGVPLPVANPPSNLKSSNSGDDADQIISSPLNDFPTEEKKCDFNHGKQFSRTLNPRQLAFSAQPELHPSRCSQLQHEGAMSFVSRGIIQSQESFLCLPGGETHNTHDDQMLCYSESPLANGLPNINVPVELPFPERCRDWSLDDWKRLSRQNLSSVFERRVVDSVLSKNRDADSAALQLPSLFDDSTIGVSFNMIGRKPASRIS